MPPSIPQLKRVLEVLDALPQDDLPAAISVIEDAFSVLTMAFECDINMASAKNSLELIISGWTPADEQRPKS